VHQMLEVLCQRLLLPFPFALMAMVQSKSMLSLGGDA
jgi:hypothetical protein